VPLAGITRREVQQWVNTLAGSGLSAATVRHVYRAVFKSVLTDAIDDGRWPASRATASNCPPPPCP
jgi:hypothetical protein